MFFQVENDKMILSNKSVPPSALYTLRLHLPCILLWHSTPRLLLTSAPSFCRDRRPRRSKKVCPHFQHVQTHNPSLLRCSHLNHLYQVLQKTYQIYNVCFLRDTYDCMAVKKRQFRQEIGAQCTWTFPFS